MAVALRGGTTTGTSGTDDLALTAQTLPTHATGDVLVLVAGQKTTASTFGFSGAGWAEHPDSPWVGTNEQVHVIYKIAASASETAPSISWTNAGVNDSYLNRIGAFSGARNDGNPFGPSSLVSNNAANLNAVWGTSVTVPIEYFIICTSFRSDDNATIGSGVTGTPFTIQGTWLNNATTSGSDAGIVGRNAANVTGSIQATGTAGTLTIGTTTSVTSTSFYMTLQPLGAADGSCPAIPATVGAVGQAIVSVGATLWSPLKPFLHLLLR